MRALASCARFPIRSMPRPEIIAHRGTPRTHPENSLPGFALALALGADGIELDVQLTADGVPVVHHDPDLAPGTSRHAGRTIAELTLSELCAHRLAGDVSVPTLAEVLALVDDHATVYVEVKARGAEEAVAALLRDRGARAPVHGFDHRVPQGIGRRSPSTPVGILSASYLVDTIGAMRSAGARDLWQHWTMIDAALVESVRQAGGRLIAWTVNDPTHAVALARMGVAGICTDLPELMLDTFASHPD